MPKEFERDWVLAEDGSVPPKREVSRDEWEWVGGTRVRAWELARPFDTFRADNETRFLMAGAPPTEESYVDPDEFQRAFDEWADRANAGVHALDRTDGALRIYDLGLAGTWYLIVSGAARGQIWRDGEDWDADLFPVADHDGAPMTFAEWYLDWLAEAEAARPD